MKTVVALTVLFFLSFHSLGQVKKDKLYKKIADNIDEVKAFKDYLLLKNYQKDFKTSIVYGWQELQDSAIKRFSRKFDVRTIRIIPKSKYPTSTDFFNEDENRIELVLKTTDFFSRNRSLVFDCSSQGVELKDSLSAEYEIAEGVYLF